MQQEWAIASILEEWQQGVPPTGSTWKALIQQELADPLRPRGMGFPLKRSIPNSGRDRRH